MYGESLVALLRVPFVSLTEELPIISNEFGKMRPLFEGDQAQGIIHRLTKKDSTAHESVSEDLQR